MIWGWRSTRRKVGVKAALQHLAKAVNIAFQTDYGENYLESVYQAAIVRRGEVHIVHREYFGFGDTWFGQFGRLVRSLELTLEGPDPASPEGQAAIKEKGPRTIRGILNLIGRKLDLVAEYEDRVPAYVEQMFDRLEASGIIVGWNRDDWEIWTTTVGLDIRIAPKPKKSSRCRNTAPIATCFSSNLIRSAAVLAGAEPGKSFTTCRYDFRARSAFPIFSRFWAMRRAVAARAAVRAGAGGFATVLSAAFSFAGSGEGLLSEATLLLRLSPTGSSTSPANASSNRLTRDGFRLVRSAAVGLGPQGTASSDTFPGSR